MSALASASPPPGSASLGWPRRLGWCLRTRRSRLCPCPAGPCEERAECIPECEDVCLWFQRVGRAGGPVLMTRCSLGDQERSSRGEGWALGRESTQGTHPSPSVSSLSRAGRWGAAVRQVWARSVPLPGFPGEQWFPWGASSIPEPPAPRLGHLLSGSLRDGTTCRPWVKPFLHPHPVPVTPGC